MIRCDVLQVELCEINRVIGHGNFLEAFLETEIGTQCQVQRTQSSIMRTQIHQIFIIKGFVQDYLDEKLSFEKRKVQIRS